MALAAAAFCLGATACHTVKGVGRDIQSVGQAGSDAIH
jgi:predicted small secreted protein